MSVCWIDFDEKPRRARVGAYAVPLHAACPATLSPTRVTIIRSGGDALALLGTLQETHSSHLGSSSCAPDCTSMDASVHLWCSGLHLGR